MLGGVEELKVQPASGLPAAGRVVTMMRLRHFSMGFTRGYWEGRSLQDRFSKEWFVQDSVRWTIDYEVVKLFNTASAVAEPPVSAMAIGTGGKKGNREYGGGNPDRGWTFWKWNWKFKKIEGWNCSRQQYGITPSQTPILHSIRGEAKPEFLPLSPR